MQSYRISNCCLVSALVSARIGPSPKGAGRYHQRANISCLYHISKKLYKKNKDFFYKNQFKFHIRNIIYHKLETRIYNFFWIYKIQSFPFPFICVLHCKSCQTLLTNHRHLMLDKRGMSPEIKHYLLLVQNYEERNFNPDQLRNEFSSFTEIS